MCIYTLIIYMRNPFLLQTSSFPEQLPCCITVNSTISDTYTCQRDSWNLFFCSVESLQHRFSSRSNRILRVYWDLFPLVRVTILWEIEPRCSDCLTVSVLVPSTWGICDPQRQSSSFCSRLACKTKAVFLSKLMWINNTRFQIVAVHQQFKLKE